MMNKLEYQKLKSKLLKGADQKIDTFIASNNAVLKQYIESVIENLEKEDIDGIKSYSYQLFSMASSFKRDDITRVCDIIYKSMMNKKFAKNKPLLKVFTEVLLQLQKLNKRDKKAEENLTKKIYISLREANSN